MPVPLGLGWGNESLREGCLSVSNPIDSYVECISALQQSLEL